MVMQATLSTKIKKVSVRDMLEYLFMLIVFLFGQSVYIRMIESGSRFSYFAWAASFVVLLLIRMEGIIDKKAMERVVLLVLLLLFYLICSRKGWQVIIFQMVIPIFLCTLYCANQWNKGRMGSFLKKYSDITIFFAFVSNILYILGTCLHILPQSVDTYSWKDVATQSVNYFHLMYEAQTQEFFGMEFIRNCGIFCEAPSYAVPLLFSFAYELFASNNKINIRRVGIILVAVLTSLSTKAMLIALVAIGLKMLIYTYGKRGAYKSSLREILKLFVPITLFALGVIGFAIFDKKTDSGSYLVRMDNIYACLKAFSAHKLFGVGVGNESALANYVTIYLDWQGFAMGLPVLLGEGGIYLILFYAFAFVHAIRNPHYRVSMICFEIVFVLILFTSNIPYFLSVIFVLSMQYSLPYSVSPTMSMDDNPGRNRKQ